MPMFGITPSIATAVAGTLGATAAGSAAAGSAAATASGIASAAGGLAGVAKGTMSAIKAAQGPGFQPGGATPGPGQAQQQEPDFGPSAPPIDFGGGNQMPDPSQGGIGGVFSPPRRRF